MAMDRELERAHIGSYRAFPYGDVLRKYLEYLGYHVMRMINPTEGEGKSIVEAREQGIGLKELSGSGEERLFKEADLLAIKVPECIARADTSVDQAVHLIKILRFFSIYGHCRESLNLTIDNPERTTGKPVSMKGMIRQLTSAA